MKELKNRGVSEILIAVVDGLKGFREAIKPVFRETQIQTCIAHPPRHSLEFAGWKEYTPITAIAGRLACENAFSWPMAISRLISCLSTAVQD